MGNTSTRVIKQNPLRRTNSMSKKTPRMNDQDDYPQEMDHEMAKSKQQRKIKTEQKHYRQNTEGETFQHQIQHDQTVLKDNKEGPWLQDLTKNLNLHFNLLDSLNATMDAQRGCTDFLLRYFADNTVTDAGNTTRAKDTRPEDVVDVILNLQKSCESISGPLQKTFSTLHSNIDNSLEWFGLERIVINKQKQRRNPEKITNVEEASSSEVRKLEEEVRQLKLVSSEQKSEIDKLKKRNEQLTSELQRCRPQKAQATAATVQVFYLHGGNTIKEIERELKTTLGSKLGNINLKTRTSIPEIDPNKLVIVLYIVSSRVGADAANAIKDIPYPGNTILVLIHYKDAHSLSSERSSGVLNGQQFRNLYGILDLAFTTESGFYHCEMNESSIDALCTLCRQRSSGDKM